MYEFLQKIHPHPGKEIAGSFTLPWTDELCADLIGLNLALSQIGSEPYCGWREPTRCFYDGIEVFQVLLRMVEEYRERKSYGSKLALVPTHPHGLLRMEAISRVRKDAGVPLGDRFQMVTQCFRFSRHVLDEIFREKTAD